MPKFRRVITKIDSSYLVFLILTKPLLVSRVYKVLE